MPNKELLCQLLATWLVYNSALLLVLLATCVCFDRNEYEVLGAMMVFTAGLVIMQYDWWALKSKKYLRHKVG